MTQPQRQRDRDARQAMRRPCLPDALRPEEDPPLERAAAEGALQDAGIDLFVQPGHPGHDRRMHLDQIRRDGVHRLGEVDRDADVQEIVFHHALENVRQRQPRETTVIFTRP